MAMAAAAACKRLAQLRTSSGIAITQFSGFGASKSFSSNSSLRSFSQLARKPEGQGVPTKTEVQSSQEQTLDLLRQELEKRRNENRELVKQRDAMQDRSMELRAMEFSDVIKAAIKEARRDAKIWIGTTTSIYAVVLAVFLSIELKKPDCSTDSSTPEGASSGL